MGDFDLLEHRTAPKVTKSLTLIYFVVGLLYCSPWINKIDAISSTSSLFLRDRAVRCICKSLATFAATGEVTMSRVKKPSKDTSTPNELDGWWRPVDCSEGSCGFKWISCKKAGPGIANNPTETESKSVRKTVIDQNSNLSPQDDPNYDPEESELVLRLPSPEEWERRMNATMKAET